ncbi:D-galactarolactone isomerase [Pararhizobium capsulatum DSM 1112]|uniref:D-galactarolactone isomerase n=1 Tax=Pararhizobium capsulatum DSM 1112 TaxID=1121113 RepID=A0ABU0BWH2_9HYPH|nr:D-galactarolactone isomerase [Pararhizobium capsulatum DSM 1112]
MLVRPLEGRPLKYPLPEGAVDSQMHMYLPGYPSLPGGPDLPAGALPDAAQYRRFMKWFGIDRVIITQGNAHQRNNDNLVACLKEMGDTARGVAAFSPDIGDDELDAFAEAGIIGARIMDLPGGAVGLDALEATDDRANARGWMIAVQFDGNRIVELEPRLARLKSRWVFDHHGKFFAGAAIDGPEIAAVKRLIDGGKCWFKFAGVYESSKSGAPGYEDVANFSRHIAKYAPERIVWGSNWPHNLAKTTEAYPDDAGLADTVLGWFADDAARRRALLDNPQELYRLPRFKSGDD